MCECDLEKMDVGNKINNLNTTDYRKLRSKVPNLYEKAVMFIQPTIYV